MNKPTYPDTAEGAMAALQSMADPTVVRRVAADGTWVPDPSIPRVWGVMDGFGRVRLVLTLEASWGEPDFTCDDEWGFA
jgi:hypothetical protein